MATYLKRAVERPAEDLTAVRQTVSEILERIQKEGMDAVRFYSKKFDGWEPRSFRLSADEIRAARRALPASEIADIDFCQAQIRNFAAEQMRRLVGFEVETLPGVHLGQKIIPVASSGSYVPGGRYPMLASAHMTVITPKVAGVKRIVASSPPAKGQGPWPATVYSMAAAGADEIYCMGGVHALAAMAYGMEGLAPVDMVVGAGNKYVAEAKRQLFGTVGIDLLAGPTEILIICDETADPSIVAADLLGQAEHDPNAQPGAGVALREDRPRHHGGAREAAGRAADARDRGAGLGEQRGRHRGGFAGGSGAGLRRVGARAPRGADEGLALLPRTAAATTARSSWARRRPSPTATRPSAPTTCCRRCGRRATRAACRSASS